MCLIIIQDPTSTSPHKLTLSHMLMEVGHLNLCVLADPVEAHEFCTLKLIASITTHPPIMKAFRPNFIIANNYNPFR